jgi:electron transfer flavoprotein alpha subunit
VATAQVYGGKLLAEVALTGDHGVCTVVAGSFPAAGAGAGSPAVEALAPPAGLDDLKTSFLTMIEPEGGDVDITSADALVSVGRGIGSQDNMELVQELADAIGAPLSASRPVTDLGWLPKTRQVGKSGLKVKPKVYLTFGISGAPEHLEGMRDAELIIACNTDPAAPIFDVAHYGTTIDLFDLVPALTDKLG